MPTGASLCPEAVRTQTAAGHGGYPSQCGVSSIAIRSVLVPDAGRDFLASSAAIAASAVPIGTAADHPDADLIRLCAEHIVNMVTFDCDGGDMPVGSDEEDPLWFAYERTRDAITAAKPSTLEGMLAKARAAKAEGNAGSIDNPEHAAGTPAERWAWQLVNDLLAESSVA